MLGPANARLRPAHDPPSNNGFGDDDNDPDNNNDKDNDDDGDDDGDGSNDDTSDDSGYSNNGENSASNDDDDDDVDDDDGDWSNDASNADAGCNNNDVNEERVVKSINTMPPALTRNMARMSLIMVTTEMKFRMASVWLVRLACIGARERIADGVQVLCRLCGRFIGSCGVSAPTVQVICSADAQRSN